MYKLIDLLNEAKKTNHFNDRVNDRLNSHYTTFIEEPKDIRDKVFNRINFLTEIDFGMDITLNLYKSNKPYFFEKYNRDKKGYEKSEGNNIWALIRSNELDTLYYTYNGKKPNNFDFFIYDFEKFMEFIREYPKHKNFNRTSYSNYEYFIKHGKTPIVNKKEDIFIIDNSKYILSQDKTHFVNRNNPKKVIDLDYGFEMLNDEQKEYVMNLLENL